MKRVGWSHEIAPCGAGPWGDIPVDAATEFAKVFGAPVQHLYVYPFQGATRGTPALTDTTGVAEVQVAPGAYRFGSSGRNILDGPGTFVVNLSVSRRIRLAESTALQFRLESFNTPNHPIFSNPGLTVGSVSYGVIGATVVDSRQIQFALRLQF